MVADCALGIWQKRRDVQKVCAVALLLVQLVEEADQPVICVLDTDGDRCLGYALTY